MPRKLTYIDSTTHKLIEVPMGGLPLGTLKMKIRNNGLKKMGVKGWIRRCNSPKEILALLKEFSKKKFPQDLSYNYRRYTDRFGDKDGTTMIKGIYPVKCYVCKKNNATSFHHIVLIKNGGADIIQNRIPICSPCHREIHPWMKNKFKEDGERMSHDNSYVEQRANC